MPYELQFSASAEEKLFKLARKNRQALEAVRKKLEEVCLDPHRYKPLSGPLKGCFRIHVLSSFVIIFRVNDADNLVFVCEFAHHDEAYK